jgi:hypothetical protein
MQFDPAAIFTETRRTNVLIVASLLKEMKAILRRTPFGSV